MKTTSIYRTQATAEIEVSTVLVRDGGARFYETAIVVNGRASDGLRTTKKFDAGFEHDAVVSWAKGWERGPSKRIASLELQLADLRGRASCSS